MRFIVIRLSLTGRKWQSHEKCELACERCLEEWFLTLIVSITKFSIAISYPCTYLSRNRSAITWVSITTFCNWILITGYPCDLHVNYARFQLIALRRNPQEGIVTGGQLFAEIIHIVRKLCAAVLNIYSKKIIS